ncbi:glycerophosphodiester phosphodiesterase [Micromonospora sp. NPDC003197]
MKNFYVLATGRGTAPSTRSRPRSRSLRASLALTVLAASAATVTASVAAPAPASAEPGKVHVSENFDSGSIPTGWRIIDGTWKVQNGRLVGTSPASGDNFKITFGTYLEHFRVDATVRFESVVSSTRWTSVGMDVPANGSTPWWIATMRSGTTAANGLEFGERTTANAWNVTNTGAAPSAAGTGRDVQVSIEVHGSQARWIYNGREALRTSSLRRSGSGGQAFFVNGATVSFDNVRVTELAPNSFIRTPDSPLTVIAHRGASSAAPENTLIAQDVARRGGANWIETDVQPSKDGVPFILHDSTVDRTTNGTGAIRTLTSTQLKALDAGSWFAPYYAGVRLPTLAEQLADLRDRGGNMFLEIKSGHTKAEVSQIVSVIRQQSMTERVLVQSFDVDALRYARELAPELPLGLIRSTLDADPVATATELGLAAYNPSNAALLTKPAIIADLHRAGVAMMVWTVDTAGSWQQLEQLGVDGIVTNRPAELAGWNAAFLQG